MTDVEKTKLRLEIGLIEIVEQFVDLLVSVGVAKDLSQKKQKQTNKK